MAQGAGRGGRIVAIEMVKVMGGAVIYAAECSDGHSSMSVLNDPAFAFWPGCFGASGAMTEPDGPEDLGTESLVRPDATDFLRVVLRDFADLPDAARNRLLELAGDESPGRPESIKKVLAEASHG